jgi:hypothetical protein
MLPTVAEYLDTIDGATARYRMAGGAKSNV